MSDHVEGKVEKISEKPAGKGIVYNVCLSIEGQDDEWFGHGFDKPDFFEGDVIEFDIEWNGDYANFDKNTINILEEGEGEQKPSRKPARSSGRSSGGGGRSSSGGGGRSSGRSSGGSSRSSSKPAARGNSRAASKPAAKPRGGGGTDKPATLSKEEWAQKDKIIRRQACMNTAIALIGHAVANDLVALPTKKSDKLDAFIALCDEEAERLYDQYEEQVYGGGEKRGRNTRGQEDDYDDDIPE